MPKVLIDTDVYIDFLRTGRFEDTIRALYSFRRRDIFFSSVVAQELLQGALDQAGRKNVDILIHPFEKVGRILTPSHEDWLAAGEALSKIRNKRKSFRSKLSALINDTLIATSARRIGAVVYTSNQKDFELIRHMSHFELQIIY